MQRYNFFMSDWEPVVVICAIVALISAFLFVDVWTLVQIVRYFLGISTISTGWLIFSFVWIALSIMGILSVRFTKSS